MAIAVIALERERRIYEKSIAFGSYGFPFAAAVSGACGAEYL